MLDNDKNIEIGMGVLGLEFGMNRNDVKEILGKPDEIEKIRPEEDDEDDGMVEVWHYDEHELSISFDENEDWLVVAMAVSSPDYLFQGVNMIGVSSEEVMQQLDLMGYQALYEVEDLPIEEGDGVNEYEVCSVYSAGLHIWFENGMTTEMQWGPVWEEDEKKVKYS